MPIKLKKFLKYFGIWLIPLFSAWSIVCALVLPLAIFRTKISNEETSNSIQSMERFWDSNFEDFYKGNDSLEDNFGFNKLPETFKVNDKDSHIFQATNNKGEVINKNSKKIVIYAHGLESTHYSIDETIFYWEKLGFRIYSYDQRGSGENVDNGTITFGYKEADDLCNLYNVVTSKKNSKNWVKPKKVIVYGESNGAATTLSFADRKQKEIGKAKKNGIKTMFVEEAGFTSPKRQFDSIVGLHRLLPGGIIPFTIPMYKYYAGQSLSTSYDYLEEIKNVKQPLFILHGNQDKIVSCKMSIELYDRIAQKMPKQKRQTSLMIGNGLKHLGITQDTSLFLPEIIVLPDFKKPVDSYIEELPMATQFFWRLSNWIDSNGKDNYVYKGNGNNE